MYTIATEAVSTGLKNLSALNERVYLLLDFQSDGRIDDELRVAETKLLLEVRIDVVFVVHI